MFLTLLVLSACDKKFHQLLIVFRSVFCRSLHFLVGFGAYAVLLAVDIGSFQDVASLQDL